MTITSKSASFHDPIFPPGYSQSRVVTPSRAVCSAEGGRRAGGHAQRSGAVERHGGEAGSAVPGDGGPQVQLALTLPTPTHMGLPGCSLVIEC